MLNRLSPFPQGSCENIPPGYEAVSLIEALNGPCLPRQPPVAAVLDMVETPETETAVQAAEVLNRENRTPTKAKDEREKRNASTPEVSRPCMRIRGTT